MPGLRQLGDRELSRMRLSGRPTDEKNSVLKESTGTHIHLPEKDLRRNPPSFGRLGQLGPKVPRELAKKRVLDQMLTRFIMGPRAMFTPLPTCSRPMNSPRFRIISRFHL